MTTTTDQRTAVAIIEHHYDKAWRIEMSTRIMAERGRRTKAKDHAAELARVTADTIRAIIADLRDAGITVKEF
jgi:hypothetical protein